MGALLLAFLDALPVGRLRILMVKAVMGTIVLSILPVAGTVVTAAHQFLSRDSLDVSLHLGVLAQLTLLEICQCAVALSIGMALSFFRLFALLIIGLLFWAYLIAQMAGLFPAAREMFNLLTLAEPVFEGRLLVFPWERVGAQLGLAAGCLLLSAVGFERLGAGRRPLLPRRGRGAAILGGIGVALIVLVWLSFTVTWIVRLRPAEDGMGEPRAEFKAWAVARAESPSFEFIYYASLAGRAERLIAHAEEVNAKVAALFGVEKLTGMVVDTTGSSQMGASGIANWKRIWVDLSNCDDPAELRRILGHEVTHTYIMHMGGQGIARHAFSTRFFDEGLATYVELLLFDTPGKRCRENMRRSAAVARGWRVFQPEDLFQNEKLVTKADSMLVYPLGEAFAAAVVGRHGVKGARRIIQAFARPDAPPNLSGIEVWRDVFQSQGFNLDETLDDFMALLDGEVSRDKEFIASLPRLSGSVEVRSPEEGGGGRDDPSSESPPRRNDSYIVVKLLTDQARKGTYMCRFRSKADTPEALYRVSTCVGGVAYAQCSRYPGASFWYQLGVDLPELAMPAWEPWIEVRY